MGDRLGSGERLGTGDRLGMGYRLGTGDRLEIGDRPIHGETDFRRGFALRVDRAREKTVSLGYRRGREEARWGNEASESVSVISVGTLCGVGARSKGASQLKTWKFLTSDGV